MHPIQRRGRSPTIRRRSHSSSPSTSSEMEEYHDDHDDNSSHDSNESSSINSDNSVTGSSRSNSPIPIKDQSSLYLSWSKIISLGIKCILFSIIATTLILHQSGYREEIDIILDEYYVQIKQNLNAFASNIGMLSLSLSLLQKYNSFVSILPTSNNVSDHNQSFKIYNMDHIPSYCREKDALSQLNQFSTDNEQDQKFCRHIITEEMKKSFEEDGVIAIRGLLSSSLFHGLDKSSNDLVKTQQQKFSGRSTSGKQFFLNKMGVIFTNDGHATTSSSTSGISNLNTPSSAFRDTALSSLIPQVVSELLNLEYNETHNNNDEKYNDGDVNLRLLRDVLLVKDAEQFICGWHVDDLGFWPNVASSTGVNAWIAIDDMSTSSGGNFAVSIGSHKVPWRHDIYELTGATTTIPNEGFKDAEDMFTNRKGAGTCNIKSVNKKLHDKLEERKRIYDLKAGDILFLDRWLFHRTVPFHLDIVKSKRQHGALRDLMSRRYSVRYAPGTSQLPKGFGTELSILWNDENQGRSLDAVGIHDGPWYPKCWPHSTSNIEQEEIQHLITTKLPVAESRRKDRMDEMKPYLQQIGKLQREQLLMNARNEMNVIKDKRNEL